jgi:hypothetical protein
MPPTAKIKPEKLNPNGVSRPPRPTIQELGTAVASLIGINPYGLFQEEELAGYTNVALEDLERMIQQDGQAQSLYRILSMPIRASEARVTAVDGGDAEAEFIRAQLFNPVQRGGMKLPWKKVVSNFARAVITGSEVGEKVFRIQKYQGKDLIMLDKIAVRPRRTLRFLQTWPQGEFRGVTQFVPGGPSPVFIPAGKCLKFTVNSEHNPIFGQSMLLPAYYHYQAKHKLYYVGHLAYALAAIPLKKLTVPPESDPNDKKTFEQAASQLGVNTTITIPEGYGLELDRGTNPPDMTIPINHHDDQMAKAVLAQIINIGTSGNGSSSSLAEAHLDLIFIVEEAIMDDMSAMFNADLIPDLIDWNFGTGKYPILEVSPSYTDRRETIKEIFRHLAGARQANTTPDFMLTLEQAMSDILGFNDINYAEKKTSMQADISERQQAQSGVSQVKVAQKQADTARIVANKPTPAPVLPGTGGVGKPPPRAVKSPAARTGKRSTSKPRATVK